MKQLFLHYFSLFLLCYNLSFVYTLEDYEDVLDTLYSSQVHRVDKDVKRPVRFCQGFEDPEEIDCYMRSDVKSYVCTEPVTFNPCESAVRVETYHYDHILHRCLKVNVPACEGQLIRVLTLLQCLIYCHNKDPFALGKSKSMVYKLNQPQPYVPHERIENERKKILNKDVLNDQIVKNSAKDVVRPVSKLAANPLKTVIVDPEENDVTGEEIDDKIPKSDAEIKEYLINDNLNLLKKSITGTTTIKSASTLTPNKVGKITKGPVNITEEIEENETNEKKAQGDNNKNNQKTKIFKTFEWSQILHPLERGKILEKKEAIDQDNGKIAKKEFISENNSKLKETMKRVDKRNEEKLANVKKIFDDSIHKTDSKDRTVDDGFYLWDE